jgi:hypothetical protein
MVQIKDYIAFYSGRRDKLTGERKEHERWRRWKTLASKLIDLAARAAFEKSGDSF